MAGRELIGDLIIDSRIELSEPTFFAKLLAEFPAHATFLDVGCHVGQYAREFLMARPDGRVLAIDMNPDVLNLVENDPRIHKLWMAIGRVSGITPIWVPTDSFGRRVSGCGGIRRNAPNVHAIHWTEPVVTMWTLDEIQIGRASCRERV